MATLPLVALLTFAMLQEGQPAPETNRTWLVAYEEAGDAMTRMLMGRLEITADDAALPLAVTRRDVGRAARRHHGNARRECSGPCTPGQRHCDRQYREGTGRSQMARAHELGPDLSHARSARQIDFDQSPGRALRHRDPGAIKNASINPRSSASEAAAFTDIRRCDPASRPFVYHVHSARSLLITQRSWRDAASRASDAPGAT